MSDAWGGLSHAIVPTLLEPFAAVGKNGFVEVVSELRQGALEGFLDPVEGHAQGLVGLFVS
jgi:hypothetical protein